MAAAIAGAMLAGCGDDEAGNAPADQNPAGESSQPATAPERTDPPVEGSGAPESTETDGTGGQEAPDGETTDGNGGTGGSGPDQPDGSVDPDSPTNDVPPEPGTPQELFEQFCRDHPESCG